MLLECPGCNCPYLFSKHSNKQLTIDSSDLDTIGVYAERIAIIEKQMKKAAAKAGKEECKASL